MALKQLLDLTGKNALITGGSRGLGLGLYIVSQIAAAHGGGVAARSHEQSGTTFSVTLPRVSPAGPPLR